RAWRDRHRDPRAHQGREGQGVHPAARGEGRRDAAGGRRRRHRLRGQPAAPGERVAAGDPAVRRRPRAMTPLTPLTPLAPHDPADPPRPPPRPRHRTRTNDVDIDRIDYTDPSLATDPYQHLDYLAAHQPVYREPRHGVVMV